MEGIRKIDLKNLVLKVDMNYDHSIIDLNDWQDYLDCLCGDREYQKEAIRTVLIYLLSGKYSSINDLVVENYNANEDIKNEYASITYYLKKLQFPNMLSGVVDLATGTGKSFVLFGVAHIMLLIGAIKRVLVLCPSLTIETELNKKFTELLSREDIQIAIPAAYKNGAFSLVNANQTIGANDICIENIHAVYSNTGSSISDSFSGNGEDTLVLSDEVHHAYNSSSDTDVRKWKGFVTDSQYGFKYHIGFTGTAYHDDEYFNDVIYRYSLRQAIDDKIVKNINYVDEDVSDNDHEKFQKICHNHQKNKIKYSSIKPISIIVTSDINSAKNLYEDFVEFLVSTTSDDIDAVEKKVLIVTSHKDHKDNIPKLQNVDDKNDPIEWIISVSMLTEGWDVKNVFQIVPWEDRAFNSKLLVSQVLGRGLRIPVSFTMQPSVRVFNHSAWSKNIRKIVDEVLENESIIYSRIIMNGDRAKYNFELHNLAYDKQLTHRSNENYDKVETFDISKPLTLVTQEKTITRTSTYLDTKNNIETVTYSINKETKSVEEVATAIVNQYRSRKNEARIRNMSNELVFNNGETEMDKLPTFEEIVAFIQKSMQEANISGNELTAVNIEKINGKFTGLLRKKRTSAGFESKVKGPVSINTTDMERASARYSSLRNGVVVFYTSSYDTEIPADEKDILDQFKDDFPGKLFKQKNVFDFKTPLSLVFTTRDPEFKFVEVLTKTAVAQKIDAWVKSRDVGFYKISYILKRGSNPKEFNPDFFIKVGNSIAVIETKMNNDITLENYSKMVDARKHFLLLNNELEKMGSPARYSFNILSPSSYPDFETKLIDGSYFNGFNSEIEIQLHETYKNKNEITSN